MSTDLQHLARRPARAGLLALLAGVLGPALAAQKPMPSADSDPVDLLGGAAFRAPIHTAPDDPVGGAYGNWASALDRLFLNDGHARFVEAPAAALGGALSTAPSFGDFDGDRDLDAFLPWRLTPAYADRFRE